MHDTLDRLAAIPFPAIRRGRLTTLQVNLGYRCNQSCFHCHVNAGPNRTEAMDAATVDLVLEVLARRALATLAVEQHHVGRAGGLGEIVGGQSDAPLRRGQAQLLAHRARPRL